MPLAKPALESAIEALGADPPETVALCAQDWASAVVTYAVGVVPASATVSAAEATLAASLASAFSAPDAAVGMESAFAAFALTVGGGMAGFAAVPPPAPVGFAAQFAGPKPATHAEAGDAIATLIDNWMKTGTATPLPSGSPVFWS